MPLPDQLAFLKKFADDTKVGHSVETADKRGELQASLDRLGQWAEKWRMQFNTQKWKALDWTPGQQQPQAPVTDGRQTPWHGGGGDRLEYLCQTHWSPWLNVQRRPGLPSRFYDSWQGPSTTKTGPLLWGYTSCTWDHILSLHQWHGRLGSRRMWSAWRGCKKGRWRWCPGWPAGPMRKDWLSWAWPCSKKVGISRTCCKHTRCSRQHWSHNQGSGRPTQPQDTSRLTGDLEQP